MHEILPVREKSQLSFLENQAATHKGFVFSHDPPRDGISLAKELEWLEQHGYEYRKASMMAIYARN